MKKLSAAVRTDDAAMSREQGEVPGVLYGHGLENTNISVKADAFSRVFSETGYSALIELELSDGPHTVIIKDTQRNPVTDAITHVDFYQVKMDEPMTTEVELTFTGLAPAVKDLSGILVRSIDRLEVRALPRDLPSNIEINVDSLVTFDDSIKLSDLQIGKNVEVLGHNPDDVVVTVTPPRSELELESLDETVTEDVTAVEGVADKEKEAAVEGDESAKDKEAPKEEAAAPAAEPDNK